MSTSEGLVNEFNFRDDSALRVEGGNELKRDVPDTLKEYFNLEDLGIGKENGSLCLPLSQALSSLGTFIGSYKGR